MYFRDWVLLTYACYKRNVGSSIASAVGRRGDWACMSSSVCCKVGRRDSSRELPVCYAWAGCHEAIVRAYAFQFGESVIVTAYIAWEMV
jgi:hypothetical protein